MDILGSMHHTRLYLFWLWAMAMDSLPLASQADTVATPLTLCFHRNGRAQ